MPFLTAYVMCLCQCSSSSSKTPKKWWVSVGLMEKPLIIIRGQFLALFMEKSISANLDVSNLEL